MDTTIQIKYTEGLSKFDYHKILQKNTPNSYRVTDLTQQLNLNVKHEENYFPEFTREPLIPRMISCDGPALAVGDINGDDRLDIFLGSSKETLPFVLIQDVNGRFIRLPQPDLDIDISNEEIDACWADVNNDHFPDLIVANGGNEFYGNDKHLSPCIYLNDGKGNLTKKADSFLNIFLNASSVCAYDIDKDGDIDLFFGARSVPWQFGERPISYLLKNDGNGRFEDATEQLAIDILKAGMITDAIWCDLDLDGDQDLLTCEDWGGINSYVNENGKFKLIPITDKKGWWNFIIPADLDGDGDVDIVAGNQGLNSKLKASPHEPVRLYYNDFDKNGKKEQLITYYVEGKQIPFMGKGDLQKLMPMIKKKFLFAEEYARASLNEIFPPEALETAQILSVNHFASSVLWNEGNGKYSIQELPAAAQFSSMKCATILDINEDKLPDVLLFGNFYQNNIQLGRNDADFGTLLVNKGKRNFSVQSLNGMPVKSQIRHIALLLINGKENYLLAMNNDSLRVITAEKLSKQ